MEVLDKKTDEELLRSIICEIAKAKNELNCAKGDIEKATSRLNFLLVVTNKLAERRLGD